MKVEIRFQTWVKVYWGYFIKRKQNVNYIYTKNEVEKEVEIEDVDEKVLRFPGRDAILF